MITESDASPSGLAGESVGSDNEVQDFAFAFNDRNFSDRVMLIEIVPDSPEGKLEVVGCSAVSDWASNRKRRRAEIKRDNAEDIPVHHVGQVLNCDMPDTEDNVVFENQDDEAVADFYNLLENFLGDNFSWNLDCHTVVKVRTLHVSSPILAAKSPFFYKLFSNGMRESKQHQVSLRIHESEEAPLMEVLNFIYSSTLSAMTPTAFLDVFKVADKFEVASCMRYCSRSLLKLPMTRESALLYLDLPSGILMADAVQPLTDAAKQFLAGHYKEITKFQDEVLSLPLAGIEAVLSSNDLQVASEDSIYDFVLKWSRSHYPKREERRKVLGQRLGRLIRFPHMSCRKLKKVLTCSDFDPGLATKIVLEALFFKSETPHRQRILAAADANAAYRRFVDRSYKYRPVKLVEFVEPRLQCSVFLELKREECARLFPAGRVYSQAFFLGGQGFFLSAHCNMDQQSSFHCFGLFLGCKRRDRLVLGLTMSSQQDQSPERSFCLNSKEITLSLEARLLGIETCLAYPGRHSWLMTASISSIPYSISMLSSPSGNESFVGMVLEEALSKCLSNSSLDVRKALGTFWHP